MKSLFPLVRRGHIPLLLAGMLLFGACTQDKSREKRPLDLPSVSITRPGFRTVSDGFSILGSVQAVNELAVLSETSGKIIGMPAKIGLTVTAGAPLVLIDKDLREAALIAAEAAYTKAAKDAERVATLHADKLISDADIEAARLGEATARSQYLVAKKELENTTICSTIGGTVAFLGLSQIVPAGWAATANGPGVASLFDLGASIAAIRAARAEADFVVVMVHWGIEGDLCPTPADESLAASLIQAGADVVAGGHPHVLQGVSRIGPGLVDFSLGDFVWYADNAPGNLTALLSTDLGPGGTTGYEIHPARIDGTGSPQPLAGADASSASAYVASLAPGAGACP